MNDPWENYSNIIRVDKEIQKQQHILIINNKKMNEILYKNPNIETIIKDLNQIMDYFLNNQHASNELVHEFFLRLRKVLLKYRRYEILNTIFYYYTLIKDIQNELNCFKDDHEDAEENTSNANYYRRTQLNINIFSSKDIHIKPLINFHNDFVKFKFCIRDNNENFDILSDIIKSISIHIVIKK